MIRLVAFLFLCGCSSHVAVPTQAEERAACSFVMLAELEDGQDWFEVPNDAFLGGGCVEPGMRVFIERPSGDEFWGHVADVSGDLVLMDRTSELDGQYWLIGRP